MLRYIKRVFPAGNTQDVALTQNVAAGAQIILNGNLSIPASDIPSTPPLFVNFGQVDFRGPNRGYSRSVSFVSTNSLVGITFTVTGLSNGSIVTATATGLGANTPAYTTECFDTIISITSSGAANGLQVGTGADGFFLIEINWQRPIINYTLTLSHTTDDRTHTAIFSTLENIISNGHTFTNMLATQRNYSIFVLKASSAEDLYSLQFPNTDIANSTVAGPPAIPVLTKYLLIALGDVTNAGLTGTTTMIFTQT